MFRDLRFVLLAVLAAAVGRAQFPYPSPYPSPYPGQYPGQPGQYPGQYPPGNYPPGQYPPTVGIPAPQIPTRKSKDKDKDSPASNSIRQPLRAAEGTLRELGEKDLYLELANHKILKFRLLAKTQFRDKEGEQIRDSLLKPGDRLSVQVGDDDLETALRVVFDRAGSEAERTSAGRPFDHDSAKAPVEADTRSAGTVDIVSENSGDRRPDAAAPPDDSSRPTLQRSSDSAGNAPSPAPDADSPRPTLQQNPDTAGSTPSPAPSARPAQSPASVASAAPPPPRPAPRLPVASSDDIIDAARDAADKLLEGLPDFMAQQNTTRYYSTTFPAQWRVQDVVTADVVSVGGKEEYRNIRVDGKPTSRPIEKTGAWSTGEFQTVLESLLSPYTAAVFRKSADDTLAGRAAYTYNFRVAQENSNWDIYAPDGSKTTPAYTGTVWIDKQTHNVVRIEQESGPMPASFAFDKVESALEYSFIRIDAKNYPLPIHSEVLTCQRGASNCTKNEINFQNYRKFTADSTITFDK